MCANEVRDFLKISTSLHTRLAAETHLAEKESLQVTVKNKDFLTYGGQNEILVICKRDGQ